MGNLGYKINTLISRVKFKLKNNKKLHRILDNKILYVIMGLLFIVLLSTYIYSINNHFGFQRQFDNYVFKIDNIENKILYLLIIVSAYLLIVIIKNIKLNILINIIKKNNLNILVTKTKKINKLFFVYIVYSIILYFISIIELKTKILSIITPLIVYFGYKIYLFIKEDKQKFKYSFIIDSRYFFLIALILLIYTPIYIYLEDKKMAENLSIYAYYFLVIGVVYEIVSSKFIK